MKTLARAASAGFFVVFAITTSSAAQTQNSYTPAEIQTLMAAGKVAFELVPDDRGGPAYLRGAVKSELGEYSYFIRFMDCVDQTHSCKTLVFFANWDLGREITNNDYRIVNGYNDTKVYGRAYVRKGANEVGVDNVVELGNDVSTEFLLRSVERWSDVVTTFVAHFRKASSGE